MFYSEWYRARARWKNWLLALAIMVMVIGQGLWSYEQAPSVDAHRNVYIAYLSALGIGPSAYWIGILPLLATVIAADSVAWDRRMGSLRFYLSRTHRLSYIWGKWVAVMAYTATVMALGLAVSGGIAALAFPDRLPPWHEIHGAATLTAAGAPVMYRNPFPVFAHALFFQHPFLYLVLMGGLILVSACAWVSLSLVLSLWITNIYMVLAGPWMVYMAATVIMGLPMVALTPWAPLVMSGPLVNSFRAPIAVAWMYWVFAVFFFGAVLTLYFRQRRDFLD